ncbi:MAG: hypothetical protein BGO31_08770 [Bacteroidetes bacterium 43-16]|nr:MAG: hypothetical protein BGO31_08770 [Bacteroidetes bacterium 43-16]
MKYLFIALCSVLAFNVAGQQNPLAKTTWQVQSSGDGEIIRLKKIKLVDFSKKDAPFTGLYFDQGTVFHSGNSCEGYSGGYKINAENVVVLESRDGYAGDNCTPQVSFNGAYQFKLENDMLTLSLIEDYEENNEEEYDEVAAAQSAEGAEISEEALEAMAAEEAATVVTSEPEVASPVVKYEAFKTWTKAHLGPEFFRKQQVKENVDVVVALWIEENGTTKVKEISGTKNEALKRAITSEFAKMPNWNKGEVDFKSTIKVPLRYKAAN